MTLGAAGPLALLAALDRAHFAEVFSLVVSLGFVGLWALAFRPMSPRDEPVPGVT
jgi:hypothetical protein